MSSFDQKAFTEVTHEEAINLVAELEHRIQGGSLATAVYKGDHPKRGSIYIVIPCLGPSLVLPFAAQLMPIVIQSEAL